MPRPKVTKRPHVGRPQKEIDWNQFDKLCYLQCTRQEIAAFFECHEDTIDAICQREKNCNFSSYFAEKSAHGRISIRRKQYQAADKGNITMLIWLGKNWLGQSDKVETSQSEPIELAYDPNDLPPVKD